MDDVMNRYQLIKKQTESLVSILLSQEMNKFISRVTLYFLQEININKKLGEKLGISIRGGAKGHPGNPFDKEDEGIFVSKVNLNGAAARDARLKVGMRILEVCYLNSFVYCLCCTNVFATLKKSFKL